ncbi:hypothetical protein EYZ11_006188 [Aspergillus tanneri]|nr:hypothetical protein EYZ11_006188 [Aspergillus tanneri]
MDEPQPAHPDDKPSSKPSDMENQENTAPIPTALTTQSTTDTSKQSTTSTPAAKRRKLSPASKEARQQEKEERERQKLEERAKKEEEKRIKEEEKKKREVERDEERKRKEEKRKAKEEEKAVKEEEKRKREAAKEEDRRKREKEKLKKERAQMKLNSFFAKPDSAVQPTNPNKELPKKPTAIAYEPSQTAETILNDYQRTFPDFFLQSHTTIAPLNRFGRDSEALRLMREKVDASLKLVSEGSGGPLVFRPSELFQIMPYRRRYGRLAASIREIQSQMRNRDDEYGVSEAAQNPRTLLGKVRMKSLKFSEDVRPPYQGTYTKRLPGSVVRKMMRNPFHRGLPETNYDYDSEAEWEEPEEGEELDSEEEEDGSEDGEDDMEGFLDDEDDHPVDGKRRLIVGDLEPVCTGIRWQEQGVVPELQAYQMETISDSVTFPIDPFSTAYWHKPKAADPAQTAGPGRSFFRAFVGQASSASASTQDGSALGKAKRTFPAEQLNEFKQVVDGSDLTKMGLIEILKKR